MLAMPVANSTRAGGVPVLEGLQQGRKVKRKERADELGLLADGNGVNNGNDDEVHKDGHHLDDRHDHFQKGSDTSTRNGVNTHHRFSNDYDDRDDDSEHCDKCDGKHSSEACPHYRNGRLDHPDAKTKTTTMGKLCKQAAEEDKQEDVFVSGAAEVAQDGDGWCLYNSMGCALLEEPAVVNEGIMLFIEDNSHIEFNGTALSVWLAGDSGLTPQAYARKHRRRGAWGGGIEMAVCAHVKQRKVRVWERCDGGHRLLASFGEGDDNTAINLVYVFTMHFDFLSLNGATEVRKCGAKSDGGDTASKKEGVSTKGLSRNPFALFFDDSEEEEEEEEGDIGEESNDASTSDDSSSADEDDDEKTKATAEAAIHVQTTPAIQRSDSGRRRKRRKRGRGRGGRRRKTRRRGAAETAR